MTELRGQGGEENKFDEIKTTLNLMSHQVQRVETDSKDRLTLLREEVKATEGAVQQTMQDLSNKIAMDDATLQQRVQLAFEKTNGKFKEYFETMMNDHQKQMAAIGQETNARFLQNNKDIEKYIDGQLLILRENLQNARVKQDTIQEGKAQ